MMVQSSDELEKLENEEATRELLQLLGSAKPPSDLMAPPDFRRKVLEKVDQLPTRGRFLERWRKIGSSSEGVRFLHLFDILRSSQLRPVFASVLVLLLSIPVIRLYYLMTSQEEAEQKKFPPIAAVEIPPAVLEETKEQPAKHTEEGRQAKPAQQAEQMRQADLARKAEEERQAELTRKAEPERQELAKQAEQERQAKLAKKTEPPEVEPLVESEIRAWLEACSQAYAKKDVVELVKLGMVPRDKAQDVERALGPYRSITVEWNDVSIHTKGAQATVSVKRVDIIDGLRLPPVDLTFTVEKQANGQLVRR